MKQRFVVVDLETTGHSFQKGDRIIQFAAVAIEDGQIVERLDSFVQPERDIPPFIVELTKIRPEHVAHAPTFAQLAPMIEEFIANSYFVAHNVQFDYTFLQEQFIATTGRKLNLLTIDTVELSRILYPTLSSYKLSDLAATFNVGPLQAHRADEDAEATAQLFLQFMDEFASLPAGVLKWLHPLSKQWKSAFSPFLFEWLKQKERQGYDKSKYDYYRQLVIRRQAKDGKLEALPFIDFMTYMNDEWEAKMAAQYERYERRDGQQQMMEAIYQSFTNKTKTLIEAATGTGKTLGYLVPAAFFANEREVPIVISTQTIQLQEQLLQKDIPILQQLLPFPLRVSLLKGKGNYLDLWKFEQSLKQTETSYDRVVTKSQLLLWLLTTETGDIDELNLMPSGYAYWQEVKCDAPHMLGRHNPWMTKDFYMRAKRQAKRANLIITNHSLLFSDLLEDRKVLPKYDYVVLDEAHHLEEIAGHYLGSTVTFKSIRFHFQRLIDGEFNLFRQAAKTFNHYSSDWHGTLFDFEWQMKEAFGRCDQLFRALHQLVVQRTNGDQQKLWIDATIRRSLEWEEIARLLQPLQRDLLELIAKMTEQQQFITSIEHELALAERTKLLDYFSYIEKLTRMKQTVSELARQNDETICWLEVETKGPANGVMIYIRPLQLAKLLHKRFFSKKKACVLTSATLTMDDSFTHMIEELGLMNEPTKTFQLPSPFHYEHQAQCFIPSDLPSVHDEQYVDEVARVVKDVVITSEGKTMVLFHSIQMLKDVYERLRKERELRPYVVLAQHVTAGSKQKLLKQFIQFDKAVLLGTSSFWEGVDIQGEALTSLVVVKLPFAPPDDPFVAAKLAHYEERGQNGFMQFALPKAVIRFKQGIGRLIRTADDYGVIFILDERMKTKGYGKKFLRSMPNIPVQHEPLQTCLTAMKLFLNEKKHKNLPKTEYDLL